MGGKLPVQAKSDAIRWIMSDSTSPFTFLWCLEHAFPEQYDFIDIPKLRQSLITDRRLYNYVTLNHAFHIGKHRGKPKK